MPYLREELEMFHNAMREFKPVEGGGWDENMLRLGVWNAVQDWMWGRRMSRADAEAIGYKAEKDRALYSQGYVVGLGVAGEVEGVIRKERNQ